MKALEFKAKTNKGVIELPDSIQNIPQQDVRVILLFEEKDERKKRSSKKTHFRATMIKTKGFKFNREKANER